MDLPDPVQVATLLCMDAGGVVVLVLAVLGVGGPLFVFLRRRQVPVARDWAGRERSDRATPGYDGLSG